ncbi:RNA polymerase sigma factor [Flavobacterium sp.]|uniref:RNA polymerase sigma factor n=1 Tax=Flavobacterium sp. TaxID=239 RepID=UPI003D103B9E
MSEAYNSNTCNEALFTSFFKTQVKTLRNFLIYRFGSEAMAEDVTQEAFIKLWQNCKEVPIEKAKAYLYTLANNACLNQLSHQKVVLHYQKKHNTPDKTIENPEFLLEEAQFKARLLKAIDNLNETQRTAFLMHRIDGKKYAEIAEELNISVKAVEKRIHLALIEIRQHFENFK